MKKSIILVLILAAVGSLYYFSSPTKKVENSGETTSSNSFKPDPSSATFVFDDGPVTLSEGSAEVSITPTSAVKETFELEDIRGYGDVNNDGEIDTAVVIVRSGGGSGVFINIAAYVSGNVSYKGTNAIFVGDRISPLGLSITNGIITFRYLDRKPDEPFAADPTVEISKQFVVRDGELVER